MKVETYEVEEINNSEASTMAADSEAIELIEKLGLDGQKSLCNPNTATRFPYPVMSEAQAAVFSSLFPVRVALRNYGEAIIPLRVLQVAAFAKDFPQTRYLEVWHTGSAKEDPILVGKVGEYSGTLYLLARWGDALPTFDDLKAKAKSIAAAQMKADMLKTVNKIKGYIEAVDELAEVYLSTGKRPSWSAYD